MFVWCGRKAVAVELGEEERVELERVVRMCKALNDLVLRCRVVLAAAEGRANVDMVEELGCNPATAGRVG